MTATSATGQADTTATARLRWDVIKARVAEIRDVPPEKVTDQMLADFFGNSREAISRQRNGHYLPRLEVALDYAARLDLPVEDFTERGAA